MRRGVLILLTLLLAACGWLAYQFWDWRSGKIAMLEPPAKLAQSAPQSPAEPARLLLFGDSRIAQWKPAPDRDFPIIVEGHPGQTAIRLAPRFAAVIAADRPAAAILQLGVNDAVAAAVVLPEKRAQALEDSLSAIEQMALIAQANGVSLTIMAVIPPVRPDLKRRILFRGAVDAYVEALNARLPAVAARHGARFEDPMPRLTGPDGTVPDRFRRDSLHLTPAAYAALDPLVPYTLAAPLPENAG